jgi:hypothetical protein
MHGWQPVQGRNSILNQNRLQTQSCRHPFIDLLFGIAEPSTRDLIVAGVVTVVLLAVFLRIKLG